MWSMFLLAGEWGQGLTERNPASHAIWWIAGVAVLVLAAVVVIDLLDWIRFRSRSGSPEIPEPDFNLEEPESTLRQRHFERPSPRRRLWPW